MCELDPDNTAPCVVCGALPQTTCDFGYAARPPSRCSLPLCWTHTSVESGPEDPYGWDGVDLRCPQHATPHRQTVPYGQAWRRIDHLDA